MNRDAETVPARHETPDVAELRRLAEAATPGPWSLTDGDPAMSGQHWTIRRQGVPGIRISGFTYGFNGDAELIVAAVNALPALLDAAAERDALAAKVERVRALHGPRVVQVLGPVCSAEECDHEDACPLVDYTVCGHCYDVGDGAHPYAYEEGGLQDVAHPCATYRALDATPETG